MISDTAEVRKWYADELAYTAPIRSGPLREAFAQVPREHFLPAGPWDLLTANGAIRTPDADPKQVYHNVLVVLDAAKDINNGLPGLWANLFDVLDLEPGSRVLHIGCGSGYYTAILAAIVGPDGHVWATEIENTLRAVATANLAPWPNVHVTRDVPSYNEPSELSVVVVSAGVSGVPLDWVRRLAPGGRLLLPLTVDGEWSIPGNGSQTWKGGEGAMLLVRRVSGGHEARFLDRVGFYHCVGGRSFGSEKALEEALQRGDLNAVKSFRLGTAADDSAWLTGDGWWLSTAPVPAYD